MSLHLTQIKLGELEAELIEINANSEKLQRAYNELLEYKLVLQKVVLSLSLSHYYKKTDDLNWYFRTLFSLVIQLYIKCLRLSTLSNVLGSQPSFF